MMEERETFQEDKVEQEVLTRKPTCFVIFGKPGAGKTTLAKRLAAVWKCQLVDGTTTIEQAIRDGTDLGIEAKERLLRGEELEETFVVDIILEKLNSPEIKHYGYVLDGLPTSGDWKLVSEQVQLLHELDLPPDIIINLKIPDQDLSVRRMGQKVDPLSGELFVSTAYKPLPTDGAGEEKGEEGQEDEEQEKEEEDTENHKKVRDEFEEDLVELDSLQHRAIEIADRLVCRPEDMEVRVQEEIQHYHAAMLRFLEDYMIQHSQQHVIELDANLSPQELFRALLVRLTVLGVPRMPAPCRLINPEEDDEEDGDEPGVDSDTFLQQLAGTGCLMPYFRWRRSRWGRLCPVQLAAGNIMPGRREFSVGFLDKMYSLSSSESLVQFTRNPRAYLLPPQPQIPCKVCVVGPPTSGKTALAQLVAQCYNAMVLDINVLLEPVVNEAREAAVQVAREEAQSSAIATVTEELTAQQAGSVDGDPPNPVPEVSADHPKVRQAVEEAESRARTVHLEITSEMYMKALKSGIQEAERKRREADPTGPLYGGWVVDGFPHNREHWAAMIDQELLPDAVVTLNDEDAPADYLLERFTRQHRLPDPSTFRTRKEPEANGDKVSSDLAEGHVPEEVADWEKKRGEYQRQIGPLVAAIKGTSIDPISLDCTLSTTQLRDTAVQRMESVFEYRPVEVDEDAEMDDDPVLDTGTGDGTEEEEGEEEELTKKRKPWGDTSYFCPVALGEQGVLWPGSEEHAIRYRERLYYFSSDEAKQKFNTDFTSYLASTQPIKPPPLRVMLLGARGSGKTEVGRLVASKLGVFHVAFRDYLQEQLLVKMKKPPLMNEDEWDPGEVPMEKGEDEEKDRNVDDLDEDVRETLTEEEEELKAYLKNGEPLSEDTMDKYTAQFWDTEPYKSTGFIMEGFPSSSEELQFMASRGRFPDAAVVLKVEVVDVIKRLLGGRFTVWKRKKERRLEKRAKAKEKKIKEWEEDKQKRKAELTADYEARVAARLEEKRARAAQKDDEDDEEEEGEGEEERAEYEEQLAELEAEEMEEEEDEEEEEDADAKERMKGELTDRYEEENDAVNSLQDTFTELQIPYIVVNGSRRIPVVEYSLKKALAQFTTNRAGLLAKSTPIDLSMAKKLLDHGYKQLSKFKRWCPVELSQDSNVVLPPQQKDQEACPVIYGPRIYFPASQVARKCFMDNPEHYISVPTPGPAVPIRLAIVGPPKSGKSTVAGKLCDKYGCLRLSIGEAVRRVIAQFPHSELTHQLLTHLHAGETVPEELCVLALDRALLDVQCTTRGYVLDGWPLTKSQMHLLTKHRITPVIIVEMQVSDHEMLRRANLDRNSPMRTYPVHDSANILLVRSANYRKHVESVREWYSNQHHNWLQVDGERSQWYVWKEVKETALTSAQRIQHYLARITSGLAAALYGLCITPAEFKARLGEFSHYCPVNLAQNELVDCSHEHSLKYSAEFRGVYYKMSGQMELEAFLHNPEQYVAPAAPKSLPPPDLLPVHRSQAEIKAMFPKRFEIQGFCPVTYIDGKRRYECIVSGSPALAAEYKNKLYCFASEAHLEKFMRRPDYYEVSHLPAKLPPPKQPVSVTSLPMLGYLEQSAATSIINALTAVGAQKPKYPFLSSTKSALIYVAYHLKAYNPKSSDYVRSKYKKKLAYFEEKCGLIAYLSTSMCSGYYEPSMRPIDFDHKISRFLALKQCT